MMEGHVSERHDDDDEGENEKKVKKWMHFVLIKETMENMYVHI